MKALATWGWGGTPRQLAVQGWYYEFDLTWLYNGVYGHEAMYGSTVITEWIFG